MLMSMPARAASTTRIAAVLVATVVVLAGAGCGSSAGSAAGTPAGSPGASASTPTGSAPAGATVDPCGLVTAADVKTAIGQTVSDTERYESITDDAGTTEQCALITTGKPLAGGRFDALSALASGFTGQALTSQSGANIGVILVNRTDPYDASAGDVAKLPGGSRTIPGLGSFAVVVGVPDGGGVGFAQTSPTEVVVVCDVEDRTVPSAELEALLRAAVAHL